MGQVLVVGGGIAGLAAAYELHRQGVPFTLFESSTRPGGVVLSEQVGEFTIDAGPDSLLVQKPDGIRLCEELGLGDRLVATKPPRIAYVQRDGRLHPLPAASVLGIPTRLEPFVRTRLFSWAGKARMGAELFVPRREDDDDESIGAFMTRRFGREATEYLAEPLLAGIHAGDVDRLSLRALFPRFREVERESGSLLKGFRRQQRSSGAASADGHGPFRSLAGGLSELTCALAAALPHNALRLRATAVRVLRAPGAGYRVETAGGQEFAADSVVLATPAFVTAGVIRALDADLASLCGEIPYASTAAIALGFLRSAVAHPLNGSGFVVPRVERTGILAASWLSSKWPHRAPDDKVLMRAFAGGARDPRALERSDGDLVAIALGALRPLLGIAGDPLFARVYRWERANAQHEVGHLARMTRINDRLSAHPGLFVTGSGFRGVGIPDCVADGRATARQATTYLTATKELRN